MDWTEDMQSRFRGDAAGAHATSPGQGRRGVVLFTTCDQGAGRATELLRLISSVHSAANLARMPIRHYILLQRAPGGASATLREAAGPSASLLAIGDRVSLSRARNLMLGRARRDGALAEALWVAFPDDDAWYPPSLLSEVNALFTARASLALVACRYGTQPAELTAGAGLRVFEAAHGYHELIRAISSNTMMIRASVVDDVGGFDERLGLGARINGGEDLDYALRVLARPSGSALFSNDELVGHRDRMPWVRSRYFAGSLFALARAARSRPSLAGHVLRKLLVGISLVGLRELSMRELVTGARTGLSGWFMPAPEITLSDPDPGMSACPEP